MGARLVPHHWYYPNRSTKIGAAPDFSPCGLWEMMMNYSIPRGLWAALMVLLVGTLLPVSHGSDADARVEWTRTFGGADVDWGWAVEQTADGGFVFAGETGSFGSGSFDAWLIKTDADGNEQWNAIFGGAAKDGARAVRQTADGGFVLAGYVDSLGYPGHDFWLIKTDSSGAEEWNSVFGGAGSDAAFAVEQTSDGGFIMAGYTGSFGAGAYDVWLVKADSSGNEEWNATFGGTETDRGTSVSETSDGGFIVTGQTASFGSGAYDVWLIKTDSAGQEEWNTTFGGRYSDWGGSVRQTTDGGYIISGDTASFGPGGFDMWLIKTDAGGSEEWSEIFGTADADETAYSVRQTEEGGFIVAGYGVSHQTKVGDVIVIETDSTGTKRWDEHYGGVDNDWGFSIDQTSDGGFVIGAYTRSFGAGNYDFWMIKLPPSVYVFDDTDGEFTLFSGPWGTASHPGAFRGSGRFAPAGVGKKAVGWRVDGVVYPGPYDVFVWKFEHAYSHLMATDAHFRVHGQSGPSSWFLLDQSTPGDEWLPVGNFVFGGPSIQGVMATDNADGFVIADAVKLIYRTQ